MYSSDRKSVIVFSVLIVLYIVKIDYCLNETFETIWEVWGGIRKYCFWSFYRTRNYYEVLLTNKINIEYTIAILFCDDFGSCGYGGGYLSQEFQNDIKKFSNRLVQFGFKDIEIDWGGGYVYQIIIKKWNI